MAYKGHSAYRDYIAAIKNGDYANRTNEGLDYHGRTQDTYNEYLRQVEEEERQRKEREAAQAAASTSMSTKSNNTNRLNPLDLIAKPQGIVKPEVKNTGNVLDFKTGLAAGVQTETNGKSITEAEKPIDIMKKARSSAQAANSDAFKQVALENESNKAQSQYQKYTEEIRDKAFNGVLKDRVSNVVRNKTTNTDISGLEDKISRGRTLTPDEEVRYSKAKVNEATSQYEGLQDLLNQRNSLYSELNDRRTGKTSLNNANVEVVMQQKIKKQISNIDSEIKKLTGASDKEISDLIQYSERVQDASDTNKARVEASRNPNAITSTITGLRNNSTMNNIPAFVQQFDNSEKAKGLSYNTESWQNRNVTKGLSAQQSYTNSIDSKFGQWLYGALYSTADSFVKRVPAIMATAAGVPAVLSEAASLIPYGITSFNNTYNDQRNRGATDLEAKKTATAAGAIEMATEIIPVGNVIKNIGGKNAAKNFIAEFAKQAAEEGLEEGVGNILNEIAEDIILRDDPEVQSDWEEKVNKYGVSGALWEFLKETGSEIAAGALSGAVSGGSTLGMGIYNASAVSDQNKAITDVQGANSEYGQNPYQLRADIMEDGDQKKEMQELADRAKENDNKLGVVDRARVAEISSEAKYKEYAQDVISGEAKIVDQQQAEEKIAKAASEGDLKTMADTYHAMQIAVDDNVREAADSAIETYKTEMMGKGITEEQWNNAMDKNNSISPAKGRQVMTLAGKIGSDYETTKEQYKLMLQGFSEEQMQKMYKDGQQAAVKENRDKVLKSLKPNNYNVGKFDNEDLAKEAGVNTDVIKAIATISGINFKFESNVRDKNGQRINASFNSKTNTITFNADTASSIVHELGEFTERYNRGEHDALTRDLMTVAQGMGTTFQKEFNDYKAAYVRAEGTKTDIEVAREMTNDLFVTIMSTEEGQRQLAEYINKKYDQQTARSKAQQIADFFRKIVESIKSLFTDGHSNLNEFQQDMLEKKAKELSGYADRFIKAFDNAVENYQNGITEQVGVSINTEEQFAYPSENLSLSTWNQTDYVQKRDEAAQALHEALGVSVRQAKDYIDQINSVASIIMQNAGRLDYMELEGKGMLMDNSEYKKTLDGSTLCKKRLDYTDTLSEIQRRLPNTALTGDEMLSIVNMMQEKGYQTPCGLCYVESTRKQLPKYAKEFLSQYAKEHPNAYVPNMAEINTPEGLNQVRSEHPEVYDEYIKYMNKKGNAKPKLFQTRAAYQAGEITDFFNTKRGKKVVLNKTRLKKWNTEGGMRLQSYSDFEVPQMIDMMQAILDMSRVGLWSQAYTKVPEFADIFGGTGVKINLSTIAKDVKNGQLVFDDVEGINHREALRIRDKYSDNVGIVTVVFNDEQLKAALTNPNVDYVLPFHRSSWSMVQARDITGQKNLKDYTPWQNEKHPTIEKIKNIMPNTYWDFSKDGRANAEKYLELCAKDGRTPKFSFLLNENNGKYTLPAGAIGDNYFKLLIDFKMYNNEGQGRPQVPVMPNFDMDVATRVLNEYKGDHNKSHAHMDIVDEFVEKYISNNSVGNEKYALNVQNHDYSFNALTSKEPIEVIGFGKYGISKLVVNPSTKMGDIVYIGRQNIQKYNEATGRGHDNNKLYNNDLGENVLINYDALNHNKNYTKGKKRKNKITQQIADSRSALPLYFENAIVINELESRGNEDYSYVMAGVYEDNAETKVARLVVKHYESGYEITEFKEVVSSMTTKKDGSSSRKLRQQSVSPSKITISQMLDIIKDYYPEELSSDVADNLEYDRGESTLKGLRYSLNVDSDGNNLTKEQAEYFKDSKVRDEDGNLMVVYHGTSNSGQFNIFEGDKLSNDSRTSQIGQGFYFTNIKTNASEYMKNQDVYGNISSGKNPYMFSVYLNITNPFTIGVDVLDLEKAKQVFMDGDYAWFYESGIPFELNNKTINGKKYSRSDVSSLSTENKVGLYVDYLSQYGDKNVLSNMVRAFKFNEQSKLLKSMKSRMGYDGIVEEYKKGAYQYVAFDSNQIKNINNTKPTKSEDIRHSLDVDLATEFVSIAQEFDWYNVYDEVGGDTEIDNEVHSVANDIAKGNTGYIVDTLEEVISDDDYSEYHERAKKLLSKIRGNARRYSLVVDDKGRKLSEGQKRKFAESEAIDEDGNLLTVYHGSVRQFFEFDRSYANVEGDLGKGFYFTNDENDVDRNYANRDGADFTSKVEREAELIEEMVYENPEEYGEYEGMDHDEIVEALKDKYATAEDPVTMECYIDIKNPVYIGNYNGHWNTMLLDGFDSIDIDDYEDEDEYDLALSDAYDETVTKVVDYVLDNIEPFDYDQMQGALTQVLYDVISQGGSTFENLKDEFDDQIEFSEGFYDENYDYAGSEVARLVAEALGYDGIIDNTVSKKFRNMDLKDSTVHFVVFDSSQAKFVTNENPTDAKDVRYSLDITDTLSFLWENDPETASILSQGMEALKNQKVDVAKIRGLAIKLRNEFGSSYDVKTLTNNLEKVFAYLQTEDHVNYNDVVSILNDVAKPVIEAATYMEGREEYQAFIDEFKGYRIKLNDKQKKEVISLFGSYGEYKNAVMPIRISDKGTITLDEVWGEISDKMPWLLPMDTTELDMPMVLSDALAAVRPTPRSIYGGDIEDVSRDFAMRVIEEYIGGEVGKKMKSRNEAYKQRLREDYNKRLTEARARVRSEGKDKLEKYKQSLKHSVDEAKYRERWAAAEGKKKVQDEIAAKKYKLEQDYEIRKWNLEAEANKDAAAREKEFIERKARLYARNKQKAADARERQAQREQRKNIQRMSSTIVSWIENPTEKNHVPKSMRLPLLDFISAFDFVEPVIKANKDGGFYARIYNGNAVYGEPQYEKVEGATRDEVRYKIMQLIENGLGSSTQQTWLQKMESIRSLLKKAKDSAEDENADYNNIIQMLDPELVEEFDNLISANAKSVDLSNMSSSDLKTIAKTMKGLMHAIRVGNNAITQMASIEEWAQKTIDNSKTVNLKNHTSTMNKIIKTFSLDMATPDTFFSMMGEAGKSIMKTLSDGFDRKVKVIKAAQEYVNKTKKDLGFTDKDIDKLTGENAEVIPFKFGDQQIKLTRAQLMSLYVLNKRNQAVLHFAGGLEADTIKVKEGKNIVRVELNQNTPSYFTRDQIVEMTNQLSDKEKKFADALQQFLANECGKWGNEASMLMYGYEKFLDPNYFPISTDKTTHMAENTDRVNSLNGIERMGMTKDVSKFANNPLIIKDIFDVYIDHTSQMSAYYGYAAAIKDANRWFNFKFKEDIGNGFNRQVTVKSAINTNVFRTDNAGIQYYDKLIRDINGNEISDEIKTWVDSLMGTYKGQSISGNMRVVIQQPTAIVRAANVIDWKYLAKGIDALKIGSNSMERIKEVCPLAWWKSQGYYETSMGKPIKEIITGQASFRDKLIEKSMWMAGKADDITWSVIYTAVEKEQAELNRGKKVSEEDFRKQVNERFNEIIYETQVVDAVLQKSQWMRGKGTWNKLQTSFMAEPIKSYNMGLKAAMLDYKDMQNGNKTLKRTGKAMLVLAVTDMVNAAAQSFIDAFRHKDDDDKYWEMWLKYFTTNFLDNINPFKKVPVVKDIWTKLVSKVNGDYEFSNDMQSQALDSVLNVLTEIKDRVEGSSKKTGFGSYMVFAKAISVTTGIPFYNVSRDLAALYNSLPFDDLRTKALTKTDFINDIEEAVEKNDPEQIKDQIDDAINKGDLGAKDIKDTMTKRYKKYYKDALGTEGKESADQLLENFRIFYEELGMSDDEIQEMFDGWSNTKEDPYAGLDAAIESGEGIRKAMIDVLQSKKDDDVIEHLMSEFGTEVDFESTIGSTEYQDKLTEAFTTINGTYTYDNVVAILEEQAPIKAAEKEKKQAVKEANTEVIKAIESGDLKKVSDAIAAAKEAGATDQSLKTKVTTEYKDQFIEAYKNGDTAKIIQIRNRVAQAKNKIDNKKTVSQYLKEWEDNENDWKKKIDNGEL